jgi:hypothetical protein
MRKRRGKVVAQLVEAQCYKKVAGSSSPLRSFELPNSPNPFSLSVSLELTRKFFSGLELADP